MNKLLNLTMLAAIVAIGVCATTCSAGVLPVYCCLKVATPPVIDGKLDDEAWKIAAPVTLVLSTTGKAATKNTVAKMCWDNQNLYIAFECEDEDIWNDYTKHNDPIFMQEICEAFLCPTNDLNSYYEIDVSPRNVTYDSHIRNAKDGKVGKGTDPKWDCVGLRTGVCLDGTIDCRTDKDRGFSAEMAIPFASLCTSTPKSGERWRANLFRVDLVPAPKEFQAWSPTMIIPAKFHVPDLFGTVFFEDF